MAIWNQTPSEENHEKPSISPTPSPAAPHATAIPVAKEGAGRVARESVFGAGVTIEGKIEGDADIRIAGKFKGDIQIKGDLHVDKGARLTAKVSAANVTLGGELDGNVVASGQVRLMESAQMPGDLMASPLTWRDLMRQEENVRMMQPPSGLRSAPRQLTALVVVSHCAEFQITTAFMGTAGLASASSGCTSMSARSVTMLLRSVSTMGALTPAVRNVMLPSTWIGWPPGSAVADAS